jgi:alpha/beta superfamily hydrolase
MLLLSSIGFSQVIDTTNGRYYNEVFPSVTVTSNITYGSATGVNGQNVVLIMDIYQPTGDTVSKRPLIVWAHGGSFIGGSKVDGDVVDLATHFAKMGYVCASINYRVGMFPIDSINATKAVIRATQDMKAAVRFFRKDAATSNSYKIHSNYIFAGGSSAGAFMSLHLAYMDKVSEIPAYVNIANMDGIDGASGNPGYSHHVNAVINLCGALGDSIWAEAGDIPFCSMHGNMDQTVPYGKAMISVAGYPIMVVAGSAALSPRAVHIAVNNPFYTYWGADHVPYYGNVAYMDTTLKFVKNFLRPLLVLPSVTSVTEQKEEVSLKIYPNPSTGDITIGMGAEVGNAVMYDITGRSVGTLKLLPGNNVLKRNNAPNGIYFIKVQTPKAERMQKVVLY